MAAEVQISLRAGHALLGFAVVAGCGWLIDASCLLALSRVLPPGVANVASSLTAATCVYLVAHRYIHDGRRSLFGLRLSFYGLYTLTLILIASIALDGIAGTISAHPPTAGAVLAAKAIITPPQFVCNFLMSRYLARATTGGA